jgi:hypothetical protein
MISTRSKEDYTRLVISVWSVILVGSEVGGAQELVTVLSVEYVRVFALGLFKLHCYRSPRGSVGNVFVCTFGVLV